MNVHQNISHPTPTFKYTRKNIHTNTKIYGDGFYWEIFIKIKNILFWFVKLPATGVEIFQSLHHNKKILRKK